MLQHPTQGDVEALEGILALAALHAGHDARLHVRLEQLGPTPFTACFRAAIWIRISSRLCQVPEFPAALRPQMDG
jgi:hypothetical protein